MVTREEIRKNWSKLPNVLTGIRLFLSPIPGFLFIVDPAMEKLRWWAMWIFIGIAITDILDGYLARKRDEVTDLGKMLDPLVDKVLIIFTLFAISFHNPFVWFPMMIIFYRETKMSLERARARERNLVIPASKLGKAKMVAQCIAAALLLAPLTGVWSMLAMDVLWAAVALTLYSWYDYSVKLAEM